MSKQYISWEHYEADRSRVRVWKMVGFGLVLFLATVFEVLVFLIF